MGIAKFINRKYSLEELFGEVELAVSQLADPNFSGEEDDRPEALMRLLFLIREQEEENHSFYLLDKAIAYAFQHVPYHKRAVKGYLHELTDKGKKQRRSKKQTKQEAKG